MNITDKKAEKVIAQYFPEGLDEQDLIYFDKEKAYNRFLLRVKAAEAEYKPKKKISIYAKIRRVAAVILLLISFGGFGYWMSSNVQSKQYANMRVEAPLGSKVKLYLPDGTLVWLNAGSSIEYSQALGIKDRKLTLNGEAYFEVARNERKTFEVTSNDVTVSVLGTKFNFRNYADEERAGVTLIEGKVCVKKTGNEEVILHPNQQIAYYKNDRTSEIINVKAAQASEWINGIIFFDGESLPDIVRELERLYNVRILIANESLKSYRFYGKFYRTDQTIQEVIDMLASTDKLKYTINNKVIILY